MGHFILDPTDFDDIIKCSAVSEIKSLEASVKPGSITPYVTQQPQRVYNSPENQQQRTPCSVLFPKLINRISFLQPQLPKNQNEQM